MRKILPVVSLVAISGCTSAGMSRRTESWKRDGTHEVSITSINAASLYEEGMKRAIGDLGSMAGGLWDAIPDEAKVIGASALGLGGVGFHTRRIRKVKENVNKKK